MNLLALFPQPDLSTSSSWIVLIYKLSGVIFILIVGFLLWRIAERVIRTFLDKAKSTTKTLDDHKQIETLGRVFNYVVSIILAVVIGSTALSELGISIAPLLATAGIAGIAIGFGAQSLVKDFFTGLVILVENQIRQGDVVDIAGKSGVVEEMTLRFVRLRDYEGAVHYIPNGAIDTVTNRSRTFAYAVMDIGVAYKENTDEVIAVMKQAGEEIQNQPEFSSKILESLEVAGVERWADSAVIIRCRFKVVALEQWAVRREFLGILKKKFDQEGIEIPFPHMTVYSAADPSGLPTSPPRAS